MDSKYFTRIFVVVLLMVCSKVNAGVFIDAGASFYERPSGSLWQQDFAGYPTQWDTHPAMFRFGYDMNGIRFSYFDLGKYGITALAGDNETEIVECRCMVSGPNHMYYTTGSMRGFSLSYKKDIYDLAHIKIFKPFFIEAGIAKFRQSLLVEKDDGWNHNERLWGDGYMIGGGVNYEKISFGLYTYKTNIGGRFGNGATPAGTGGANVLAIEYSF